MEFNDAFQLVVFLVSCSATLAVWVSHWMRLYTKSIKTRMYCTTLLAEVETQQFGFIGMTHPINIFGDMSEALYMGDVYRKYISKLSQERKNEILDKLLMNNERKYGTTDLVKLVSDMHATEIETIAAIIGAGSSHDPSSLSQRELPNAIILYRLSHPHNAA
jgi:hypothetical protein